MGSDSPETDGAKAVIQWQPIETAPKDGKPMLGFDPTLLGVCIAEWDGKGWWVNRGSQDGMGFPDTPLTDWAPINPPEPKP